MRAGFRSGVVGLGLASALALGGCETTAPASGPVTLTRFHLPDSVMPGVIAIEPPAGGDARSLAFQADVAPIAAELGRLGFRVAPPGTAATEQVAAVTITRDSRVGPPRRPPVSIGIGGGFGTGGWRSGADVGGGVSFPVGHARSGIEIVGTQLAVQLKRRGDGTVFWEGRAFTEARADAPEGAPGPTIARLAQALFAGFPGDSGRTITVK